MCLTMTKSGVTHFISLRRAQVYFFKVEKVRDHPFYIRAEGTGVCFYIDS